MQISTHAGFPTLLLDLDGTLVDSLGDLAAALALSLRARGAAALDAAEIGPMVGDGLPVLVERAFARRGLGCDAAAIDEVRATYEADPASRTRLYPGAMAALDAAAAAGFRLALCTNKPGQATRNLLAALGLAGRFAAIGAGDSFAFRKPDPRHLLLTLDAAGGTPEAAVMVGDHHNDVEAARGAGIPAVFALWGYGAAAMGDSAAARAASWDDVPGLARSLLER